MIKITAIDIEDPEFLNEFYRYTNEFIIIQRILNIIKKKHLSIPDNQYIEYINKYNALLKSKQKCETIVFNKYIRDNFKNPIKWEIDFTANVLGVMEEL